MGRLPLAGALVLALVGLLVSVAASADSPSTVPRVEIATASGATPAWRVELAVEPSQWSVGLMNRPSLPENAGMLFVFPTDTTTPFWMQNTLIPLSIAFVAADGGIVDLQDMEPQTTVLHYPRAPYRSALEVNQGSFRRRGVAVGDRVVLWERRALFPLIAR